MAAMVETAMEMDLKVYLFHAISSILRTDPSVL